MDDSHINHSDTWVIHVSIALLPLLWSRQCTNQVLVHPRQTKADTCFYNYSYLDLSDILNEMDVQLHQFGRGLSWATFEHIQLSPTSLWLNISMEYLEVLVWNQWWRTMARVDSSHTVHPIFSPNLDWELHCIWVLIDSGTWSKIMASELLNGCELLHDVANIWIFRIDILIVMYRSVSSMRVNTVKNINHSDPDYDTEVIFIVLSTYDNLDT